MKLFNSPKADEVVTVNIRDCEYPVSISGTGIPVVTIGDGIAMERTLSTRFRESFQLYATDLYWAEKYGRNDRAAITLDIMLDDILSLIKELGLDRPIVLGHSAFGILALEFAKRYPDSSRGFVLIGTPVNSNPIVAANNLATFEEVASQDRIDLYKARCKEVNQEDFSEKSIAEQFMRQYIYRDAPIYWHQMDFNCTELWEGILPDDIFEPVFGRIFPETDVLKGLHKVNRPVYLAAGMSDYDCCPWKWKEVEKLPQQMVIDIYQKSGHYPHFEETEKFDERICEWAQSF